LELKRTDTVFLEMFLECLKPEEVFNLYKKYSNVKILNFVEKRKEKALNVIGRVYSQKIHAIPEDLNSLIACFF
jgi:hypothetical protein